MGRYEQDEYRRTQLLKMLHDPLLFSFVFKAPATAKFRSLSDRLVFLLTANIDPSTHIEAICSVKGCGSNLFADDQFIFSQNGAQHIGT